MKLLKERDLDHKTQKPPPRRWLSVCIEWSRREPLNLRSLAPEVGALQNSAMLKSHGLWEGKRLPSDRDI